MLKKNDIIELSITSATAEGSGVGKTAEGLAVFVPLSAVGDRLKVKILKVKKTYAFGKIEEIIEPSKARIEPDCECFRQCGGCVWRHIDYAEECGIKRQKVVDAVERIGGIDTEIKPLIACGKTDRYRNKAQFPVGRDKENNLLIGFYAFRSHRIIDCADCSLQPKIFSEVIEVTRDFVEQTDASVYDEKTGKGRLRHLYIRMGEVTNELMVCYVINGNGLKGEDVLVKMLRERIPNLKTVVFNSNKENTNVILGAKNRTAYGNGYITDELCGLKFKISPFSFWQVNRAQAEKLYEKAKEYAALTGNEVLLDLYCGTGTIGLTMAKDCKKLVGVEIIEDAVRDAENNAAENGITNAEFICSDASSAAVKLKESGLSPDVVIVDPPRKGCGEELVKTIVKMKPERVVYVSCDPATLARDLKYFDSLGYKTKEVTPVDMFPRTAHIETVVLLSRKNIDDHLEFTWTDKDFGTKGCRATYPDIQAYIHEKFGFKVSHLNIAQIKRKCGIIERENYNLPKSEKSKQPGCTKEREDAIIDAFRHFQMIP